MNVDPSTVLALIADLYRQVGALTVENERLRQTQGSASTDEPPRE